MYRYQIATYYKVGCFQLEEYFDNIYGFLFIFKSHVRIWRLHIQYKVNVKVENF
jgi:hypothetical protein